MLLGLTGFAIAQPLHSLAGDNPTLFVFHGVDRWKIAAFAVLVAVVPALLAWAVLQAAAKTSERAGGYLELIVFGMLAFFCGVLAGRALGTGAFTAPVGVAFAAATVFARIRWPGFGTWLRYLAVVPLATLVVFFVNSPTGELVRSSTNDVAMTPGGNEANSVVVVMLDELPTLSLLAADGSIDGERFPNLARFANDATWYRNFTAQATNTDASVPSMLSGLAPVDGEPLWTEHPNTIFTLFAPTHRLVVSETFTRLCGVRACEQVAEARSDDRGAAPAARELVGLWFDNLRGRSRSTEDTLADFAIDAVPADAAQPLDVVPAEELDEFDAPEAVVASEGSELRTLPAGFRAFLDELPQAGDGLTLSYLHLLLPHFPWQWRGDGSYTAEPAPGDYGFGNTVDWVSALNEARHLWQLQYTDALLGELFDQLQANGVYDDTAVVVVADHGVSFADQSPIRSIESPLARPGTAFVPLLVKAAGEPASGRVDDSNLLGVDLPSVIADAAGVELGWETDGDAPGSEGVAERGTTKSFQLQRGIDATIGGVGSFDTSESAPNAADRWIRPARPDDGELDALLDLLQHRDAIGSTLVELGVAASATTSDATAFVAQLDALRTGTGEPAVALVQGQLDESALGPDLGGGEVLVAVGGRVVTGSPLYNPVVADLGPAFTAPLPRELAGTPIDLQLVLARPDRPLVLLEVAPR
jgi:hypothetical protein